VTDVLAALAARYAYWLALPDDETSAAAEEDPADVRAMPVILRFERATPPGRTDLLEAAAAAAVAVCLDPRAAPDGEWHDGLLAWTSANIRKVSRRARGVHWQAVADLPGRTIAVGGAEARALVPGLVGELPKEVTRLQISGSDLPADEPEPPAADLPVLWLNPTVPMTVGKAAAQVGHGTMLLAALLAGSGRHAELADWAAKDCRCAVRTASPARWAELTPMPTEPLVAWRNRGLVMVRDAGFTEVPPGTATVAAVWPRLNQ
jgi:peptidyl-tRNA hydrolase